MRTVRWLAGVVLAVAFPAAALVAGLAYLALRRRWSDRLVTHAAQRARHTGSRPARALARPVAVDLGNEQGPLLGRFQRGDLPRPWRTFGGRVRLPMNSPNNRHLLILGATGLGKTQTAL